MFASQFKASLNHFFQTRIFSQTNQIVGLDIGSTKIVFLVARKNVVSGQPKDPDCVFSDPQLDFSPFDIYGIGEVSHSGVKQGCIVDFGEVLRGLKKAKAEAEAISGEKISETWVTLSGSHVDLKTCVGQTTLEGVSIGQEDVDRVCRLALRQLDLTEREVIQSIPLNYLVDGQEVAGNPTGMVGRQLQVSLQAVTGHRVRIQKLIKCVSTAGIKVRGLVPTAYASALAVSYKQEQTDGIVTIDMGGGCCQFACIKNRNLMELGFIPVGGQHFTRDIMLGLKITSSQAEELKIKVGMMQGLVSGAASLSGIVAEDSFEPAQIKNLYNILEARAKETLSLILNEIGLKREKNYYQSGIVFTGGTSQLNGLLELGLFLVDERIKFGEPFGLKGIKPKSEWARYSAALGLLHFGADQVLKEQIQVEFLGNKGGVTAKIQNLIDDFAEKSQKVLVK